MYKKDTKNCSHFVLFQMQCGSRNENQSSKWTRHRRQRFFFYLCVYNHTIIAHNYHFINKILRWFSILEITSAGDTTRVFPTHRFFSVRLSVLLHTIKKSRFISKDTRAISRTTPTQLKPDLLNILKNVYDVRHVQHMRFEYVKCTRSSALVIPKLQQFNWMKTGTRRKWQRDDANHVRAHLCEIFSSFSSTTITTNSNQLNIIIFIIIRSNFSSVSLLLFCGAWAFSMERTYNSFSFFKLFIASEIGNVRDRLDWAFALQFVFFNHNNRNEAKKTTNVEMRCSRQSVGLSRKNDKS